MQECAKEASGSWNDICLRQGGSQWGKRHGRTHEANYVEFGYFFEWDAIVGEDNPHMQNFEIMVLLFAEYLPAKRNEGITRKD